MALLYLCCMSCYKNDIYKTVPLSSKLSIKILKESNQIIVTDTELILSFVICEKNNYYNNYLLFFDKFLKLYSACFIPTSQTVYLENDTFKGELDNELNQRISYYRNNMPIKYHMEFKKTSSLGVGSKCNKVVDKIFIDTLNWSLRLCIRKSLDPYEGMLIITDTGLNINYVNKNNDFNINDTIVISISRLLFSYKRQVIVHQLIDKNDQFYNDYLIIGNTKLYDILYNYMYYAICNKYKVMPIN